MVSSLKGLTRAQITARAAARRAQAAAKKGTRKKGSAKVAAPHIRVSQATVNRVKALGKVKALAAARASTATLELKEAVARIYPTHSPAKGTHAGAAKKVVAKKRPTAKAPKITLKQRQSEKNQ